MQFFNEPVPHVVIDNFLADFDMANAIAHRLYEKSVDGGHSGLPVEGLKRKEIYLHKAEGIHASLAEHLNQLFLNQFWGLKSEFEKLPFPFPMLNTTAQDSILLGFYGAGDKYSLHHDHGLITAVLYLHREGEFDGGDFILTNQINGDNFRKNSSISIESRSNRLVMFPSCYRHAVSKIKGEGMRIALTYLTALENLFY